MSEESYRSSMKVELSQVGQKDERVEFVVEAVKKAVEVFITAVRNSSEEQIEISFKAFTLNIDDKKEISQVFDFITAVMPSEIFSQAEDLVKLYTFYHSIEDATFLFHCRKIAPPTKEEIEEAIKAEEEAKDTVQQLIESKGPIVYDNFFDSVNKEELNVILPHASAISAYRRPGSGE